jgi:hypothetical protein
MAQTMYAIGINEFKKTLEIKLAKDVKDLDNETVRH